MLINIYIINIGKIIMCDYNYNYYESDFFYYNGCECVHCVKLNELTQTKHNECYCANYNVCCNCRELMIFEKYYQCLNSEETDEDENITTEKEDITIEIADYIAGVV